MGRPSRDDEGDDIELPILGVRPVISEGLKSRWYAISRASMKLIEYRMFRRRRLGGICFSMTGG